MNRYLLFIWVPSLAASYSSWLGDRAYHKGDFKEAHRLYQEAVVGQPDDMKALYNVGMTANKLKHYQVAEQAFKKVAAMEKFAEQAYFGKGDAQVMQQKYEQALESYQEVLKRNEANEHAKKRIELVKKLMEEQDKKEEST